MQARFGAENGRLVSNSGGPGMGQNVVAADLVVPRVEAIAGLLRLLPAGAVAGRALHPLESAAFARRTPKSDIYRLNLAAAKKQLGRIRSHPRESPQRWGIHQLAHPARLPLVQRFGVGDATRRPLTRSKFDPEGLPYYRLPLDQEPVGRAGISDDKCR